MIKPMTNVLLEQMLVALGFVRVVVPEKVILFRHLPTKALIALPEAAPEEYIDPLDVLTVRRTLIEKGILTESEFDRMVNPRIRRTTRRSLPKVPRS